MLNYHLLNFTKPLVEERMRIFLTDVIAVIKKDGSVIMTALELDAKVGHGKLGKALRSTLIVAKGVASSHKDITKRGQTFVINEANLAMFLAVYKNFVEMKAKVEAGTQDQITTELIYTRQNTQMCTTSSAPTSDSTDTARI